MLDYLSIQGSTENPTFVTILFTVLLSFLLSSMIAFTYQKTTRQVITPVQFLQALILVAIIAATVMQAIGDSLARGLGMLGALAIIRFRTTLRTPRNMIFTFASLAAGIACGVYGFVIGITGTIGFCIIAFILRYSPLGKMTDIIGTLKFELNKSGDDLDELEAILNRFCRKYAQVRYQIISPKIKEGEKPKEKRIAYEYQLKLKNPAHGDILDTAIAEITTVRAVRLNFENAPENV